MYYVRDSDMRKDIREVATTGVFSNTPPEAREGESVLKCKHEICHQETSILKPASDEPEDEKRMIQAVKERI